MEKLQEIVDAIVATKVLKQYYRFGSGVSFPVKRRDFDDGREGYAGYVQVTVEGDAVRFELLMDGGRVRLASKPMMLAADDVPRHLFGFVFTRLANYFAL